ncbi:hypothetical protein U1Q18_012975 [Sarracenia purpurea var. burkii]
MGFGKMGFAITEYWFGKMGFAKWQIENEKIEAIVNQLLRSDCVCSDRENRGGDRELLFRKMDAEGIPQAVAVCLGAVAHAAVFAWFSSAWNIVGLKKK